MCNSTFLNLEHSRQDFAGIPLTLWLFFPSTPTTDLAVIKVSFIHKLSNTSWSTLKTTSFMITSEDHIIQEELGNLTHILLISAYPLYLIIKNIKKAFVYTGGKLLSLWTPHLESNILLIITLFRDIGKSFIATIHKIWHTIIDDVMLFTILLSKPLSAYSKSSSMHNHLVHSAQTYG